MSSKDPYGLHVAAYKGDICEVERLLGDKRIDVNQLHINGSAPLYIAAQQGWNSIDIFSSQNQAQNLAQLMFGVLRHV